MLKVIWSRKFTVLNPGFNTVQVQNGHGDRSPFVKVLNLLAVERVPQLSVLCAVQLSLSKEDSEAQCPSRR
jgi:hypothetical protein